MADVAGATSELSLCGPLEAESQTNCSVLQRGGRHCTDMSGFDMRQAGICRQ